MKTHIESNFAAHQKELKSLKETLYGGDDVDDVGIKGELKAMRKSFETDIVPKVNWTYRAVVLAIGGLIVVEIVFKVLVK